MNSSFTVALFVVGNIVGSGFFMLPPKFALLGLNLIYSWLIAASMAFIFAIMFCRLYIIYPTSSVLTDYFASPVIKKVNAMIYWISCIIGNTGLLLVVVANLGIKNNLFLVLFIMLILTIVNHVFKYSTVARIEALLTIMKFSILVLLPIVLILINKNIFQLPVQSGAFSNIVITGISCTWAYLGIETAAIFGSGKSARRGLIIGITLASVLYVGTSLFIVACVPKEELATSATPFLLLVQKFGFLQSAKYINFIISFTALGALYGWIAATGKMSLLFAKSNIFPKQFLKNTKSDSSYFGLWLSSALSFLFFIIINKMEMITQFDLIADLCVYITLSLYGLCSVVLMRKGIYFIDYLISSLSILSVIISFVLNLKMSAISMLLFFIIYIYFLYLDKKKKIDIS